MVLLGVGQGLLSPTVSGLLSRITPDSEQGAVFGTLSSAQTLARMISYSASNILLGRVSTAAPYWEAFGIDVIALAAAVGIATNAGRYAARPSTQAAEADLSAAAARAEE